MLIKKKKSNAKTAPEEVILEPAIEEHPQETTIIQEQVETNGSPVDEMPILSPEEVEIKAEARIQSRANELISDLSIEVAEKRKAAETEIEQLLEDARVQAADMIDEAEATSEAKQAEINDAIARLEQEKQELDRIVQEEKQKAFNEGLDKSKQYIDEIINNLAHFHNAKKNILLEVKDEIVSLALDISKQILGKEVDDNPKLLEEQVMRSLEKVISSKGIIQIYLNPSDMLESDKLEQVLSKVIDDSVKLVFMKDEKVDPGSCIVNTQGGRLDASFTSQIEVIKVAFEKYLGHKIVEIDENHSPEQLEHAQNEEEQEPINEQALDELFVNNNDVEENS